MVLIALAFLVAAASLDAAELEVDCYASVADKGTGLVLQPVVHTREWKSLHVGFGGFPRPEMDHHFVFKEGGSGTLRASRSGTFGWRIRPPTNAVYSVIGIGATLPVGEWKGARFSVGRENGVLCDDMKPGVICRARSVVGLSLERGGHRIALAFPMPVDVSLQRNRSSDTFALRIGRQRIYDPAVESEDVSVRLSVCDPSGVRVQFAEPYVISASDHWIPVEQRKEIAAGGAFDLSGQGFLDAPAGKYGWTKNVSGHFEFEGCPGVSRRFYGVNLVGTMNFPSKAEADILIDRLARMGYNSIRLHHYDGGWVDHSAKGLRLNEENVRRFDYLVARGIAKGFYFTTDLYCSRPVHPSDIGLAGKKPYSFREFKPLIRFNEAAYRNWESFAALFLNHVNPYTGRAYKNEPALNLISLVNEGTLRSSYGDVKDEPFFNEAWTNWCVGQGCRRIRKVSEVSRDDPIFCRFDAETERRMFRRMRSFLDGLGIKALLTNENNGLHPESMQGVCEDNFDYCDHHFYVDHPTFADRSARWRCPAFCRNENPLRDPRSPLTSAAFVRHWKMPFTVTEWNFAAPNRYRGMGGLLAGAVASGQGWDGLWRFAYAHKLENMHDGHGELKWFDLSTDPIQAASERAMVQLFLRGDMPVLKERFTMDFDDGPGNGKSCPAAPKWAQAAYFARVGTRRHCDASGEDGRCFVLQEVGGLSRDDRAECPFVLPASQHLSVDREKGRFSVDTDCTKGGYADSGSICAEGLIVNVSGCPATVWVNSLDGRPVSQSHRLVVTHLTDVQADGAGYAGPGRQILVAFGRNGGLLAENGVADIRIRMSQNASDVNVYELDTSGVRVRKVERELGTSPWNGTVLHFVATTRNPDGRARFAYEIVRE